MIYSPKLSGVLSAFFRRTLRLFPAQSVVDMTALDVVVPASRFGWLRSSAENRRKQNKSAEHANSQRQHLMYAVVAVIDTAVAALAAAALWARIVEKKH